MNSSWSNPFLANEDQCSENPERNKSPNPNYAFGIQDLCTLKQEKQPQCITCQMPCTVKHILIECGVSALIRKHFVNVNKWKSQ